MVNGISPLQQEAALLKRNYLKNTGCKMDNKEALQQARHNLAEAEKVAAVFDSQDVLQEARTLQKNYFKNTGVDLSPKEALEQARKTIAKRNELMSDVFVPLQSSVDTVDVAVKQTADEVTDATKNIAKKAEDAAKPLMETLKEKSKNMPTWGKVACGAGIAALALFGISKASQPKEVPPQQTIYA